MKSTKANDNVEIIEFDPVKHAGDFYDVYADYVKNSEIEKLQFGQYYPVLVARVKKGSVIVYVIKDIIKENIIGFLVGEVIYPLILNVHIVVKRKHRNFYNAYRGSLQAITRVFSGNHELLIACIDKENKNVLMLLKKLGFKQWGTEDDNLIYALKKGTKEVRKWARKKTEA